ncbi:MAG: hypothetical protein ACXWZB_05305 [Gaiellaceae bacterium]
MRRLVLLLSLLLLAACGRDDETAAPEPGGGAVQSLDNVLALRSDFEADAGKTRVLLLFSPT